jgi:hypothetical protein
MRKTELRLEVEEELYDIRADGIKIIPKSIK